LSYPRGFHPSHDGTSAALPRNGRGEDPKSVGVHQIVWPPQAGVSINIPPGGMFFQDLNMTEGPLDQRQGQKIWEEDLYLKRLEIFVEFFCPYPSDQTIDPPV
jgi:hypothetical protein